MATDTRSDPLVFDYYPYRKDDNSAAAHHIHRYFGRRGFAGVRIDVRGTGGSGGTAEDEYCPQEQLDGVAAIAWLAGQPWCNGNVGMFGSSYGGFNSLQVAMHRPPALKAVCPMFFTDNRYTDDCHYKGGAMQMLYDMGGYGLNMVSMNALPPYPQFVGERWAALWEEHLQNEPWLLRWLAHQTYDAQWKQGSLCEDYESIRCATYLFGGWRDGYVNCNLRVFQHLGCPKKALVGPWLHTAPDAGVPGPRIDHLHEMVRFYDYWLKGIDTGVMNEPPVTVYVQRYDPPAADRPATTGFWRHEAGWPLARTDERSFYFGPGGALANQCPLDVEEAAYTYNPTVGTTFGLFSAGGPHVLPADQRLEDDLSARWTSEPLAEPVEVFGSPRAHLGIAVTADVATVVVRLMDVAPDGPAALVTKGVLNLTHRESHERPSPLVPGEFYDVEVSLDTTCWLFEPGHRLRVTLSGADFPNTWPSPKPHVATVRLGGEAAAQLIVPVVGAQEPALPPPRLLAPGPPERLGDTQAERPVWRVTRDHLNGTVEVFMRTASRTRTWEGIEFAGSQEKHAVASERDPARASMRGVSEITLHWPDRTIATRSRGQIESTADAFHVTVQLEITMDGLPYFSRRWIKSIPRRWL